MEKGEIMMENLAKFLILIGVLVLLLFIIGILTGKLDSYAEYIQNLFRFGNR